VFESIFETVNSGFAQALYEDFLRDPGSVPPEWRALFENGLKGETPTEGLAKSTTSTRSTESTLAAPAEQDKSAPSVASAVSAAPIKGPALRLLQNMTASLAVPTATSFRDMDVARLWSERAGLNAALAARGIKLSFTHLIAWALVRALRYFPSLTHAVGEVDGQPHRLDPGGIHLGLAVDVERKDGSRGLMVPVIKHAETMDFARFHAAYERLVAGARDGKLLPDAYQGGTVSLTNPGTLGTVASVPRLMQGQGSIIATGAIRELAGVKLMTITSTYDHRIIQGAESGSFLRQVDQLLQGGDGFYAEIGSSLGVTGGTAGTAGTTRAAAPSASPDILRHVSAANSLVRALRTHGHSAARLDPLGTEPKGDPALDPGALGLTPDVMAQIPASALRVNVPGGTLAEVLPRLRETYCGTIAYEIEHIADHEQRVWLRRAIEAGEHRAPFAPADRRRLLDTLVKVDGLERFLGKAYLGAKRFGLEGLEMLVPMLHAALDLAAQQGAREVVMGMAHRGRLNVLTHVLGLPYDTLLAEFEGGRQVEETLTPAGGTGDVKYHHGHTGRVQTLSGHDITATLLPNPSHLEAVNPVVEGKARAGQTQRGAAGARVDGSLVLPLLIHGDAAFAAQGIVAETFNLARLEGYGTGGTLHIITNNQVGFTTDPGEARSTDYSSDLAKGFDVPIIHVNADDPEACIAAVRLAMMYREKFKFDAVIDLVGYRRHGHNEADEPRYTQPAMYRRIDEHPPVKDVYANTLTGTGVVEASAVDRAAVEQQETLGAMRQRLKASGLQGAAEPDRVSGAYLSTAEPLTAVPAEALRALNAALLKVPDGFTVNPKLKKQLDRRLDALGSTPAIDWAHAEGLALASLLTDGVPVRLSGQDSERGTFSQRHLVLHDAERGTRYAPLQHVPGAKAACELHNSPLSEYAVLGFEYGYSIAAPEALVLWEAQFGDFANGGEIVLDQFIIAGLSKWGQTARLTLLLPHGYEGQGPEHSSARLERYLALGAERNIRVANCSTPAQYFHLLRRQGKHAEVRPLILMTPKSLLRLPQAASTVAELSAGRFYPALDDPALPRDRAQVTRLVFCSGKVYYDTVLSPKRAAAVHVAVGRIELLYPFPSDEVAAIIAGYPALKEVVWLQEEPSNMGARKWVMPQLEELAPTLSIRWVSRPERSSPAEGYPAAHHAEQERIVAEALA
jgi:2-oxoglutarate dehydrogenase E1 component